VTPISEQITGAPRNCGTKPVGLFEKGDLSCGNTIDFKYRLSNGTRISMAGVEKGSKDSKVDVIDQLARTATDLTLALDVIAGPDEEREGIGYWLALPPNMADGFVWRADRTTDKSRCTALSVGMRGWVSTTKTRNCRDGRAVLDTSGNREQAHDHGQKNAHRLLLKPSAVGSRAAASGCACRTS
jgi:hypothetical protein